MLDIEAFTPEKSDKRRLSTLWVETGPRDAGMVYRV